MKQWCFISSHVFCLFRTCSSAVYREGNKAADSIANVACFGNGWKEEGMPLPLDLLNILRSDRSFSMYVIVE